MPLRVSWRLRVLARSAAQDLGVHAFLVPPSRYRPDIPVDLEKKPEARYADARAPSTALAACACAGDWNDEKADAWWVDQATTQKQTSPSAELAAAPA